MTSDKSKNNFGREKIKIIISTGLFFLARPFTVGVRKMYWYSINLINLLCDWILVNIQLVLDWNNYISPCAVNNDTKCSREYMESGYHERRSCLLTPDYCETTELGTYVLFYMFYVSIVLVVCSLCSDSCKKTDLPKETKLDHIE